MNRLFTISAIACLGILCITCFAAAADAGPLKFVREYIVSDSQPGLVATGNGIPSKGDILELAVSVENTGTTDAQDVSATITSVTPNLAQILVPTTQFETIAAQATVEATDAVKVSIDPSAPDYTELTFSLVMSESGGAQWTDQFVIQVLPAIWVCPAAGNGQGVAHVSYDPQANRLYATNSLSGNVAEIDPQVGSTVAMFRSGVLPGCSAPIPDEKKLLVIDQKEPFAVSIVDLSTYQTIKTFQLEAQPIWVAYDSVQKRG